MGVIGLTYSATGMVAGFLSTILIAKFPTFYFFKKCIQALVILSTIAMVSLFSFKVVKRLFFVYSRLLKTLLL